MIPSKENLYCANLRAMIHLACTKKLRTALHLPEGLPVPDGPEAWHGDLFMADRRRWLLLTHAPTLFCVLLRGVQLDRLPVEWDLALDELARHGGFPKPPTSPLVYGRTASRPVLGSMRGFIRCAADALARDKTPHEVNLALNRTPMSLIGYRYPVDMAREHWS